MKILSITDFIQLRRMNCEYAIFDVRNSYEAHKGHIFGATFLPLRLVMRRLTTLVPKLDTKIILYDNGNNDQRAIKACSAIQRFGYNNVYILEGGIEKWCKLGYETFEGSNVPSKWFGEHIHIRKNIPVISAIDLQKKIDNSEKIKILDIRSPEEYIRNHIPGAVGLFGADIVLAADNLCDIDYPIVVHCSGRTRSIIACATLQALGIKNSYALEDGTMGWRIKGFNLESKEAVSYFEYSKTISENINKKLLKLMKDINIKYIDYNKLLNFNNKKEKGIENIYIIDVRQVSEYLEGHVPGSIALPGGLAIQRTDEYIPVRNAKIILIDNEDNFRAYYTAYWLYKMGITSIHILENNVFNKYKENNELSMGRDYPKSIDNVIANKIIKKIPIDYYIEDKDKYTLIYVDSKKNYLTRRPPKSIWIDFSDVSEYIKKNINHKKIIIISEKEDISLSAALNSYYETNIQVPIIQGGVNEWSKKRLFLMSGPNQYVKCIDDEIVQAYDKNIRAMKDYLKWEKQLIEKKFPNMSFYNNQINY